MSIVSKHSAVTDENDQERDPLRREDSQTGGVQGVLQGLRPQLPEDRVLQHHAMDHIRAAQEGGQQILRIRPGLRLFSTILFFDYLFCISYLINLTNLINHVCAKSCLLVSSFKRVRKSQSLSVILIL